MYGYYAEIYKLSTGVSVTWQTHYMWTASCIYPPTGMEQMLASIDRSDEMYVKLQPEAILPREVLVKFNLWM